MLAVHLDSFEIVEKVMKLCFEEGVIVDWFLYNLKALRISPPLIIKPEEIAKVSRTICSALDRV